MRWIVGKRNFLRLLSAVKLNLFSVEVEELRANIVEGQGEEGGEGTNKRSEEDEEDEEGQEGEEPKLGVQLDLEPAVCFCCLLLCRCFFTCFNVLMVSVVGSRTRTI